MLPLARGSTNPVGDMDGLRAREAACMALCPEVVREWLGEGEIPAALVRCLKAPFAFVLIHGLKDDPVSQQLLRAFLPGESSAVRPVADGAAQFGVARQEVCGAFAGLQFGPAPEGLFTLRLDAGRSVEPLISVGGAPLFARCKADASEIFFLAGGAGGLDWHGDFAGRGVREFFAQVAPVAMFLRHAFQQQCWCPAHAPQATLIMDDPPLWQRYGFLNYERLLAAMDEYHFHTTVAFIPYYWKSSVAATVRLFRERPERLSVCFHGNDHTAGELASHHRAEVNYVLTTARARMRDFTARTGIACDNVMVFPQGRFSPEAMEALGAHGFAAAVNSGHAAWGATSPLTLEQRLQPAIEAHGFPLFLREYVEKVRVENVAWNAFFGRPTLLVEHHEIFRDPRPLFELVSRMNESVPGLRWSNLQTSLEGSCWSRLEADGGECIRSWARAAPLDDAAAAPVTPPGFDRRVSVHLRRWLSQLRDNHLSRYPRVMALVRPSGARCSSE
jgi:hypothetical protein